MIWCVINLVRSVSDLISIISYDLKLLEGFFNYRYLTDIGLLPVKFGTHIHVPIIENNFLTLFYLLTQVKNVISPITVVDGRRCLKVMTHPISPCFACSASQEMFTCQHIKLRWWTWYTSYPLNIYILAVSLWTCKQTGITD